SCAFLPQSDLAAADTALPCALCAAPAAGLDLAIEETKSPWLARPLGQVTVEVSPACEVSGSVAVSGAAAAWAVVTVASPPAAWVLPAVTADATARPPPAVTAAVAAAAVASLALPASSASSDDGVMGAYLRSTS